MATHRLTLSYAADLGLLAGQIVEDVMLEPGDPGWLLPDFAGGRRRGGKPAHLHERWRAVEFAGAAGKRGEQKKGKNGGGEKSDIQGLSPFGGNPQHREK